MKSNQHQVTAPPKKRDTVIRVRVSRTLKNKLQKKARAAGCPISALIRHAMDEGQPSCEKESCIRLIMLISNLAEEISRYILHVAQTMAAAKVSAHAMEEVLIPWVGVLDLLDAMLHQMTRWCC